MKSIASAPVAAISRHAFLLVLVAVGTGRILPPPPAAAQCLPGAACGSHPAMEAAAVCPHDPAGYADTLGCGPLAAAGPRCAGCCARCQFSPEGNSTHCGMPAPPYPVPFATPRPTVPTYFTYPPMMPHNSLHHYRGTYAYKHGPGMSRTTVHWRAPKALNALKYLHHVVELPR